MIGEKDSIVFDLDGTLIDVAEKYYKTYSFLLNRENHEVLSKDQYWKLKREKKSELDILMQTNAEQMIASYAENRKKIFETEKFIKYDTLFADTNNVLSELVNYYNLYIVSLRHNKMALMRELKELDLVQYFSDVLSGENVPGEGHQVKVEIIEKKEIKNINFIIGDMPTDIKTGKIYE